MPGPQMTQMVITVDLASGCSRSYTALRTPSQNRLKVGAPNARVPIREGRYGNHFKSESRPFNLCDDMLSVLCVATGVNVNALEPSQFVGAPKSTVFGELSCMKHQQ